MGKGLGEYFVFYNSERPHQALGQETPDVVYRSAMGGGAMIVDNTPARMRRSLFHYAPQGSPHPRECWRRVV